MSGGTGRLRRFGTEVEVKTTTQVSHASGNDRCSGLFDALIVPDDRQIHRACRPRHHYHRQRQHPLPLHANHMPGV